MPGNRQSRWASVAQIGIVAGIALIALGYALFGPRGGQIVAAEPLSPDGAAVYQTKDKLVVTVNLSNPDRKPLEGTLGVELIGPDDQPLGKAEKEVRQTDAVAAYRFELPTAKQPTDQLKLRYHFGQQKFETPLNKIVLAKAHETSLTTSKEFFAGSPATIRCGVHGFKSYTDSVPLVADVEIRLRSADGKTVELHKGKTGINGIAQAQFKVPSLPEGKYTLEVATRSGLGEETLKQEVKVKTEPKILLVTDKPLYQPGQVMHIRALSLKPMDLTPVGDTNLVFEVEDAKGNKVFKRTHKTSEYGIASVDFQLADEVNMGDYQVRAILGEQQAQKTVAVKRYVLPKFKVALKANKNYYLPKEKIEAELQVDYFFGKPVAEGKIKVTASTFDVQFKEFQTWEGKTDKQGHAKLEIQLPDYFVGQPLEKGNALVRLEAKVIDTADHSETITKTYNVSNQAIRVNLIPESGRLVPGMENTIFAAATYPDGSPAQCDAKLWIGRQAKDKPFAEVKTNEAGLAEFKITPKQEQFRKGNWEQRSIEMLGGQTINVHEPKNLFDLFAEAKDAKGNAAHAAVEINGDDFGENVLLRLDKAIYKGGDTLKAEIRSSAGLPTAYLDIVRGGQTLLTRWLDVKDGKAEHKLDLPANIFGTLEIHAYQMLAHGEIIRDSRVVYVHPPQDLKIEVKADKDVYQPGEAGRIRFLVTDAAGQPTPAALGVIIVDEAVYALQEMQPGLEKVYFTLQEELLKPQAQVVYKPSESIDLLVRDQELPKEKQQIAQALLTSVKPKPPARWEVAPAFDRRQKLDAQVMNLGMALFQYAQGKPFMQYDEKAKAWSFKAGILEDAIKQTGHDPALLNDPFGKKLDLEALAKLEKGFTADRLAEAVSQQKMNTVFWTVQQYVQNNAHEKFLKDGKWTLPETVVDDAAKAQRLDAQWLKDTWGEPLKLVKLDKKWDHQMGDQLWIADRGKRGGGKAVEHPFNFYQLVSAGPDRKFGTEDDVKQFSPNQMHLTQWWWMSGDTARLAQAQMQNRQMRFRRGKGEMMMLGAQQGQQGQQGGMGGMPVPEMAPAAAPMEDAKFDRAEMKKAEAIDKDKPGGPGEGGGAAPMRVREYFPETMLWQPALITDEKGVAHLPLTFADSITTWRLSASASSKGGLLGGTSAELRVFQDFFVDLDLPVALTQNDEVSFPVAVYNYLKDPQTVKLELEQAPWFELVDAAGPTRTLDLKPNEVTAIKFRIRATKIGYQPLTVKARGTKLSDAIKRVIEVAPDGKKIETVVTDRLKEKASHTIDIPATAVPDSQKLIVKLYPGVFSQVMEGTEGMLRLPGG